MKREKLSSVLSHRYYGRKKELVLRWREKRKALFGRIRVKVIIYCPDEQYLMGNKHEATNNIKTTYKRQMVWLKKNNG